MHTYKNYKYHVYVYMCIYIIYIYQIYISIYFLYTIWRRKWQSIPVLPGESHRQMSLVGYGPWGHKESDMTK